MWRSYKDKEFVKLATAGRHKKNKRFPREAQSLSAK